MATMNSFPPDVPKDVSKDIDEAREDIEGVVGTVRAKASNLAEKATETVKDGYYRAKDAIAETDPVEFARESGEAVKDVIVRNPLAAFGLGALSVGLIAWAGLRGSSSSRFERYEPDYGRLRSLFGSYRDSAADSGESALKSGAKWLRSNSDAASDYADQARGYASQYASQARDYADYGGRLLAKRAEREPIAALLGVGIAVYVIGSLLSSAVASEPAPARKRTTTKR